MSDPNSSAVEPLSGYRIVDLTQVLNGPYCTMLLAHMGAEVLKIEYGSGDHYRSSWMAPDADHDGYEFMMVNSNKKGITLNLKTERGREIFLELVKRSDVVVENFSLGVMDRLGLGYLELKKVNPKIIYACSRGYGDSGPRAHVRANASTIMASAGWTAASWEFSKAPGTKAFGVGDEAGGVSLTLGVLAALLARERTGIGQKVEVSMQEALMGLMVSTFHTYFEGRRVGHAPTQCADGYVAFHSPAMTDELWARFAKAMGHPEAIDDPRFATVAARRTNFDELEDVVLTQWVRAKTRAEMAEVFAATAISAAPIMEFSEVMDDEHLKERGAFVEIEDPRSGKLKLLRPWIRFSEMPTSIKRAAPSIGQDNYQVYGDILGLSEAEISDLADKRVI